MSVDITSFMLLFAIFFLMLMEVVFINKNTSREEKIKRKLVVAIFGIIIAICIFVMFTAK